MFCWSYMGRLHCPVFCHTSSSSEPEALGDAKRLRAALGIYACSGDGKSAVL
jgi:hypothetical protein